MSVNCIVADDNPLLDFISIKNLNLNLSAIQCQVFIAVINLSVELNHSCTPAEPIGDTFTCTGKLIVVLQL